jgi:pimeloyl-ACP methyl ester carboxylesterase
MLEEVWLNTNRGMIYGMAAGDDSNPLVLGLHGWSQRNGWHTWQPLLVPIASAGFFVVSIDMPGWGRSEPWSSGSLGHDEAIEAVLAVIDGLGHASAHLMGKSWGGGVAIATALAFPGQVGKLILTAPAYRDLDKLAGLSQPVLLAWAQDDPVIPYPNAEMIVEHLPDCQLITYASGGHSAAPKNAADFAPKAIAFLRE